MLQTLGASLQAPTVATEILKHAIREAPSVVLREGGVIADGYDAELDELRNIQTNHGDFLLQYEAAGKSAHWLTKFKS